MEKKKLSLIGSVLLAGGILAGCSGGEEAAEEPTKQVEEQPAETEEVAETVEQSVVKTQIDAYKAMTGELANAKEDKEVNWDTVKEAYTADLQAAVTEVNGDYDQAITAAIEGGKSGDLEPNVARQLIDKTTQSYFYQKQKRLHKDVAAAMNEDKLEDAKLAFAELKELAEEVLIPTAVKRDSYFELSGEGSMEENIRTGLAAQEEALNAGNADDFVVYKQLTDKTIYRSYYLAALSYAEKIEKAVAEGETDATALRMKQAEAWGFYQAIKGSLSGGNEEAANTLNTLFTLNETDPATIKADEVKDLFAKAFVGKILSYHEKAPSKLEEGNVTGAKESALEGNVFLKDIELYMVEKLGEEQTNTTLDKAEQWFNAISEENKEEAAMLSEEIVATLQQLK